MAFNENPDIHSEDITWANYKTLREYEEDKIYFIKDLSDKREMINELKNDLRILKELVEAAING